MSAYAGAAAGDFLFGEASELDVEGLAKLWPYVVTGAPGVWAIWRMWATGRKEGRKDRADLVRIAQEAAGAVIKDLRDETARLQQRVHELEEELSAVLEKHADSMLAKDARITLLEGEIRHWKSIAQVYEQKLTENSIPHEKPAQPIWMVSATEVRGGTDP